MGGEVWKVIQEFIFLDPALYGMTVHLLLKSLQTETPSKYIICSVSYRIE